MKEQDSGDPLRPMEKSTFLACVFNHLQENPTWFADAVIASQNGILSRLHVETVKRADAETAVCMLANDKDMKHVPAHQRPVVARVLVNSHTFGGTPFTAALAKKFDLFDPYV